VIKEKRLEGKRFCRIALSDGELSTVLHDTIPLIEIMKRLTFWLVVGDNNLLLFWAAPTVFFPRERASTGGGMLRGVRSSTTGQERF